MTMEQIFIKNEWWEERFDSKCQEWKSLEDGVVALPDTGFTVFDSIEDLEKYEEY